MPKSRKIGRSAITGRFKSVKDARHQSTTSTVEHVPVGKRKK